MEKINDMQEQMGNLSKKKKMKALRQNQKDSKTTVTGMKYAFDGLTKRLDMDRKESVILHPCISFSNCRKLKREIKILKGA